MRRSLIATAFALTSLAAVVPAYAQTPGNEAVVAACSGSGASGGACQAAIQQYFAALQAAGVVGINMEQAVADLVVALATEAPAASAAVQDVVADALTTIANSYAAPGQAQEILAVAQQIEAGSPPSVDQVVIPLPSSPA